MNFSFVIKQEGNFSLLFFITKKTINININNNKKKHERYAESGYL
jgi:hypothetical protein